MKFLVAAGMLVLTVAASASPVNLTFDRLRSASSGAMSTLIIEVPTTWDWDASTGVLTQTGGLFQSRRSTVYTDQVTGLVINTTAQTATATTYNCIEGTLGAGLGASLCANYSYGLDFANNSTVNYNVGGNADCMNVTTGGDDDPPGFTAPPGPGIGGPRGLTEHSPSGPCIQTVGARDMWFIFQPLSSGSLILWNAIGSGTGGSVTGLDPRCVTDASFVSTTCNGAHWMVFTDAAVPVPAAAWLLGSALGVLGWVRRKTLT